MRAILMVLILANVSAAGEPMERLRARAALALAFAPPTYAEQHAKALKAGKPLVVFVGQPAKALAGCVCVACETFPDMAGEGVVVGLPTGTTLRRIDLAGKPSEANIRGAIGTTPASLMATLPVR
ncbi:hypothetical protein [Limnoglobus roseus]|uniref:Uncharacterized protein n=1 Tax=Limnoglobus roseus TaxID=2598579 RepID=A0A5C1A815_9BACT|nr:hypothetical protein [Limnoglobus roseus]QEL14890.1 hypothetical protein PX52LOC_01791 [Limnoglobus roseus]